MTLVGDEIVCYTAKWSEDVLDPLANLVLAKVRRVVIDCTYAVQMVLHAFCEVGL